MTRLVFRSHAIKRMFQRRISEKEVRHVLGKLVRQLKPIRKTTPYPSRLVLGWCGSRPLHVVVADNMEAQETIVITVYEPDLGEWGEDFRKRRRQ